MDKTVNTHASNSVLAKQSLPLPRTLFSEGGSVVFSELLAESTFRPERFALDFGVKKTDLPPPAPERAEPSQNPQDCLNCQQDDQTEILRGIDEQRAQDNAAHEVQQRSHDAQQARDEQSRQQAQTQAHLASQRFASQRQEQARQEQQYRSEQIDRIASQQNIVDDEQRARAAASREQDARKQDAREREASSPRTKELQTREVQAKEAQTRDQEARRNEETASPRVERDHSSADNPAAPTQHQDTATQNTATQNTATQNTVTQDTAITETREQRSLAARDGGQEDKSHESDRSQSDKSLNNANNNDGTTNNKVAVTHAAVYQDENIALNEEEALRTASGKDKPSHALAGLVETEGIDVFALQDSHATTQAANKVAETLAQPSTAQEAAREQGLVERAARTAERTSATDKISSITLSSATPSSTTANTEGADAASVAQGSEQKNKNEEVGQALSDKTAPSTVSADTAQASVASAATTLPPLSAKPAGNAEGLAAALGNKAASLLHSADQKAHETDAHTRGQAGLVSSLPKDFSKASEKATGDKPSTTAFSQTNSAPSDGSKDASARTTASESRFPKNTPPSDLAQLSRQATAQRSAGSAQRAGGTAASTAASTQTNAQTNAQANTQANGLAQTLSGAGGNVRQGLNSGSNSEKTSLPEGIDVRWSQEVRAHRPEGLRLSGQNAFDSLRLAGSAKQTLSYGNAATSASVGTSGDATAASSTALNGGGSAQAGLASSSAAAKTAARAAERQEAARERREDASPVRKSKTSGTQTLLQSLAARLTGARGEAAGNQQGGGDRAVQTFGETRLGQSLGQASSLQGLGSQGSGSQGSNSEASLNNGFSQSLQSSSASSSARAGSAASTFMTASSFVREQVFVNIQRAVEGKVESLTVKLRPELLGRIEIRLDGDAAGRLQIVVLAERGETLDLLQRDAKQLEQALQEAGIRTQDQGLQFGLKGQGNAQTQGEAQGQEAGESLSHDTDSDAETEGSESASDAETLSSVVERLQVRQDGRLNVEL